MRNVTALFLGLALVSVGCGDDDRPSGGTDAGGTGDSGMIMTDSGGMDEDAGGMDEDAGGMDEDAGGMEDAGPEGATFTEVYAIIAANCATCHTVAGAGGGFAGNLDMSTQANAYDNLVGIDAMGAACGPTGATRVVAGDPDMSLLYSKVAEAVPDCGARMPFGRTPLTADQIETFRSWIAAGALDN